MHTDAHHNEHATDGQTAVDASRASDVGSTSALAATATPSSAAQRAESIKPDSTKPESTRADAAKAEKTQVRLSFMDKVEAFIQRLSARSHFWHRVCSMIWLPYAYKSGIRMVRPIGQDTFTAELPFRPFNRNWYNAMAGASLLANSEIAGGMYIFRQTDGKYTLVCKELTYKFLRPCFGPALYKVTPREDLAALMATEKEFNLTVDLEIIQQPVVPGAVARKSPKNSLIARMAAKERRVGVCVATFHLTPTLHQKAKRGDTRAVGGRA